MRVGLLSKLTEQVVFVLIPPLALIFLVLGTIFLGIATPTEGGAMGAAGALLLALAKRRLNFGTVKNALDATTKLSAFVMMILIGARVFGLRSEEHTSELQSLMRISYAVFCFKKKN